MRTTNPNVLKMLKFLLYVDHLYWGTDTVRDTYRQSSDAVNISNLASMNLSNFISTSNEMIESWVQVGIAINESLAYIKLLGF